MINKNKKHIWLTAKRPKKGFHWCYALARFKDGSIRVVENLMPEGFAEVGTNNRKPIRLTKDERKIIIKDLYVACCEELGIGIKKE